jgi:ketosteroid isomerase-like protein
MIRRNVRALRSGDICPLLASYADDAVLVYPGVGPRAGEYRGKAAIEALLCCFLDERVVGETHDIVVNGPQWRTTICVLLTVQATDDAGQIAYQNRAALFVRAVWGKIVYQEDFEDTHKIEAFDAYLARHQAATSLVGIEQ